MCCLAYAVVSVHRSPRLAFAQAAVAVATAAQVAAGAAALRCHTGTELVQTVVVVAGDLVVELEVECHTGTELV